MKKLLFITLLFALKGYGQSDTLIYYSNVVKVDGISKDILFNNARDWFNVTFNSSKDVLQIQDKESGQLNGKGILNADCEFHYLGKHVLKAYFNVSINIFVKDGKYKYEIKDIDNYSYGGDASGYGLMYSGHATKKISMYSQKRSDENYKYVATALNMEVKSLVQSLQTAMSKKQSSTDF